MTYLGKFSEAQSACVYPPSWYQPPDQTPVDPVDPVDPLNPLAIQEPVSDPYPNDLNDVLAG